MNKLEEKFYEAMDENLDEQSCAIVAAITKEEMKNFAEWMPKSGYVTWDYGKSWNAADILKSKTTEELIELYFNSEQP